MDLISVIVPVYKVEKYLDKCIESIVNQTYRNLEIILVDDGSPDRCPEICDKWAAKDSRIKVIHQVNGGAGKARNIALDRATGEWIAFVDSDDYIDLNMYEYLYSLIEENIDIVECQLVLTESDDAVFDNFKECEIKKYKAEEALEFHIKDQIFRQTPPNKIYRKEIIADIQFPIGNLIDDEFWTYQVLGNARGLISSSCGMYAYRQQTDSVMHKKFSIKRLQAVEAKCSRISYLSKEFPSLLPIAKQNLIMTCLYLGQMSLKYLDEKQCEEAFKIIKKAREYCRMDRREMEDVSLKNKIWINCSRISFKGTCVIRNILKKGI